MDSQYETSFGFKFPTNEGCADVFFTYEATVFVKKYREATGKRLEIRMSSVYEAFCYTLKQRDNIPGPLTMESLFDLCLHLTAFYGECVRAEYGGAYKYKDDNVGWYVETNYNGRIVTTSVEYYATSLVNGIRYPDEFNWPYSCYLENGRRLEIKQALAKEDIAVIAHTAQADQLNYRWKAN